MPRRVCLDRVAVNAVLRGRRSVRFMCFSGMRFGMCWRDMVSLMRGMFRRVSRYRMCCCRMLSNWRTYGRDMVCRPRRRLGLHVWLSQVMSLGMRLGMRLPMGRLCVRLPVLGRDGRVCGVTVCRGKVLLVVSRHLATLRIQDKG